MSDPVADRSLGPPNDRDIGAFAANGPWTVDPPAMSWRFPPEGGMDSLRKAAADNAESWVLPGRLPPGSRALTVGWHLGRAIGGWAVADRRTDQSRSGLSWRLRSAFETLGPTYIKLGQIISSGDGIFPEELVEEFRLLRDRVPPEPFSKVRKTIEEELGRPLGAVFPSFDRTPLASASVAQVHSATLATGERVVVKVQRRGIDRQVQADIAAMSWIAPFLVGRIPVAALANPPALVELFAETIVEELDFRLEAQNMLDIGAVLARAEDRPIIVPRPHPHLVTERVLVMEKLTGFPWSDVAGMRGAGIDTASVLRAALISFLEGTLLHGVFHGDLHGGNLLVRPDGTVALLDFGITGRLDEQKRLAFLRLQVGATANDLTVQIEALRDLGALPPESDVAAVIADLQLDRSPIDPTTLTAEEMLGELHTVTKALLGFGARLPKELMLFVKDLLFLNGAMATMAPDVDLLAEIVAIVEYFTRRHGEQIARDIGSHLAGAPVDLDGYRAALGVGSDSEAVTFRDLQDRHDLIRRRMSHHRRQTRRASPAKSLLRLLRAERPRPHGPGAAPSSMR